MDQQKPKRFLRIAAVIEKIGVSRAMIYQMAAEGDFPKPVKIAPKASAWVESEVDAWMDARIAMSRAQ